MSNLFFVILLVGFSGLMVGGLLLNDFVINPQEIGILDDPSEITSSECSCQDPDNPGIYGPEFCDPTVFEEGSFCWEIANQVQTTSTELVQEQDLGEGCDDTFWRELQDTEIIQVYAWPPEYDPEFHFNDIFLTNLDNSYFLTFYSEGGSPNQLARTDIIDRLQALKTHYADDLDALEKLDLAINSIQNSLNPALWINDSHLNPDGGEQVFVEDQSAISNLNLVIQNQETVVQNSTEENRLAEEEKLQSLKDIVKDIADSERVLAENAREDAQAYVKDTAEFDMAVLDFDSAQEKLQVEEYFDASSLYKSSWMHSQNAMGLYNEDSFGPTLLEALSAKPAHHGEIMGLHDLTREATAALLNAGHENVPYYYLTQEVLDRTQLAVLEGNVSTIEEFEGLNGLHSSILCP